MPVNSFGAAQQVSRPDKVRDKPLASAQDCAASLRIHQHYVAIA